MGVPADVVIRVLSQSIGAGIGQAELDAVVDGIGRRQGFRSQYDQRVVTAFGFPGAALGRGRHVGEEDIAPARHSAGRGGWYVAHIKNLIGKLLREYARLHVGGELRGDQLVQHAVAFKNGPGRQPQGGRRGRQHRQESEE